MKENLEGLRVRIYMKEQQLTKLYNDEQEEILADSDTAHALEEWMSQLGAAKDLIDFLLYDMSEPDYLSEQVGKWARENGLT